MVNLSSKKAQTAIRFWPEDFAILKKKLTTDGITLQKLCEVLVKAYMNNNKEVMSIVMKHADDKKNKKKRYAISEVESDDILNYIERNSPLKDFNSVVEKLEKESNEK
jgi:hypothetical protein